MFKINLKSYILGVLSMCAFGVLAAKFAMSDETLDMATEFYKK